MIPATLSNRNYRAFGLPDVGLSILWEASGFRDPALCERRIPDIWVSYKGDRAMDDRLRDLQPVIARSRKLYVSDGQRKA